MAASSLASALVALPLAAGVIATLVGGRAAIGLAAGTHLLQLPLVVLLGREVLYRGPQVDSIGGWQAPLGIDLRVDGLAILFLGAAAIVQFFTSLYAAAYFQPRDKPSDPGASGGRWFWPLELFQSAALHGALMGGDIFNLYVTLEILTLSAVGMIGLAGQVTALVAAIRYFFIAVVGSLFYLLGVALIYADYGTVDWSLLAQAARPDLTSRTALVLMTAGLAVKTALFPLHFWLPPAHANAPAPVSALLSALVIKASLFILLRLWFYALVPVTTTAAGNFLSGLGAAAIVWGSIQAMRQDRVKLIVAYSTVAQVGYLFLVFTLAHGEMAMLAWRGSVYLACSHACAKAAAFLAAGSLAQALGTDELQQWAGAARREPASVFALALAGVNLMGLPPSGGFLGKWLLLKAALASGQWPLAGIVLLGGLLAAIYIFRVVARTLSAGEPRPAAPPLSPLLRYVPLAPALAAIAFGMVTTETLQVLEIGVPLQFLRERAP